jgi:hypothetical protein
MYMNVYIFNVIDDREQKIQKFTLKTACTFSGNMLKSEVVNLQISQIGVRL